MLLFRFEVLVRMKSSWLWSKVTFVELASLFRSGGRGCKVRNRPASFVDAVDAAVRFVGILHSSIDGHHQLNTVSEKKPLSAGHERSLVRYAAADSPVRNMTVKGFMFSAGDLL